MAKKQTLEAAAVFMNPYDLVPWEKNPRFNDGAVDKIVESISKYGFASPIVARKEDLRVISGHTRLKAAKSLNLEKVPVRLLDLSEREADALALADNRLGEIASWDDGLLSEILEELQEDNFEIDTLGFTDQELNQLLGEWEDPFYSDSMDENNSGGDFNEDMTIQDHGKTIISISVPVTQAQDATKLIGDALSENQIPHNFKVK